MDDTEQGPLCSSGIAVHRPGYHQLSYRRARTFTATIIPLGQPFFEDSFSHFIPLPRADRRTKRGPCHSRKFQTICANRQHLWLVRVCLGRDTCKTKFEGRAHSVQSTRNIVRNVAGARETGRNPMVTRLGYDVHITSTLLNMVCQVCA